MALNTNAYKSHMKNPTQNDRINNFLALARAPELCESSQKILAYVMCRQGEGRDTNVTQLVQSLKFGTGATIYRKLQKLQDYGFISITTSSVDARAKSIHVSAKGVRYLGLQGDRLASILNT